MKVLIINSFFSVGGPPHVVKGICDALEENGDEYILAASREQALSGMNIYRIGDKAHVYRAAIQSRLLDNEGFSSRNATRELVAFIDEYQPDIIHLHNLHGYYINIEILFEYLKRKRTPTVWTLHDCWPLTGHCCHFSYVNCNKWMEKGCYQCPQKNEYPKSILLDNSKTNYIKKKKAFQGVESLIIVTVSKWLESIVKKSILKEYPVKVIYNGINNHVFYRRKERSRQVINCDKEIILGVAQNWGKKKGLYDFVELSKIISDNYIIVLVGVRDSEMPEKRDNIIAINRTDNPNELAEWYSSSSVFVNLSYEETFGLVTAEALACGTPVIVYDATATGEIVENGINGYTVTAGNIIEVWDKIQSIHRIKKDNCRCNYTESNMQMQYLELYRSIVEHQNDHI